MKKLLLLLLLIVGVAAAQPSNPQVQFRSADPAGACTPQPMWYNYNLGKLWGCKASVWTLLVNGAATAQVFNFGGTFVNAGSAIAATTIALPSTAASGCTIRAWAITVPAAESGTATVKFLRVAAGTTSPAIGDSINTSGVSLSSGDHIRSTTLSDFTSTTVTQGDVIAVALTAVTGGLTGLTANVECQ